MNKEISHCFTVSVCAEGGCLPHCMLGYTPQVGTPHRQVHSLGRHPPRHTPLGRHPSGQTHPLSSTYWDTHTPLSSACWDTHPPVQCMLGYGQQAGSMHPTGMHSCSEFFFSWKCAPIPKLVNLYFCCCYLF